MHAQTYHDKFTDAETEAQKRADRTGRAQAVIGIRRFGRMQYDVRRYRPDKPDIAAVIDPSDSKQPA